MRAASPLGVFAMSCFCGSILGSFMPGSNQGVCQAAPLWCSPFETDGGSAVTQEQLAEVIDNRVGLPGMAAGSVFDIPAPLYVEYGVALEGIPAAIAPGGVAGSFGLSTPDDRRTGINTNLRSDSGSLDQQLTFEGYFYAPSAEPVLSPTFAGRRLVTQGRSATDGESRLAIGLHARMTGGVDGLFDYEGFNYTGTALDGQAGGVGWAGPWTNAANFAHLSDDGVSLDSDIFPFTPVGSRISGTGGTSARPLSRPIDLSAEGAVTYLSALILKTSTAAATGDNLEIGLATSATVGGTGSTIRIGMTSGDAFFLTNSANPFGAVVAGTPYFVLVRIVSHTSTPDECFMNVYAPGEPVPTSEPETWMLTHTLSSAAVLTHLRMTLGANLVKGEFDEIRLGSTYASVTDPDAPLGQPGSMQNLLAVFWAEPAETPPAVINHLEFGSTAIQPNTWYHFALVYDGTDLRWYLNGNLEGQVLSPNMVPPGNNKMSIGNNRTSGAVDRGFFGVLDEVRLWDRALQVSALAVNGGSPGPGLLWRSRFETSLGQPVSNGQPADTANSIDNLAGPNGSPAGVVASNYRAYGQSGVPAVPQQIDPAGLTESFAIWLPDNVTNVAIATPVPSNAGNLASAVTMQGYFNSRFVSPVTVSAVGGRLVTQLRSASEGQVRLGIGLTSNDDAAPTHNVLAVPYFSVSANAVLVARGTTPIVQDTWYHFALVYDGTDIRFYLNGQPEGEVLNVDLTGPGPANIVVANDRTTAGTRGFRGLLDKIVITDHVINPDQLMTAGLDPCLGKWCNVPFADWDNDDDVDQSDFAEYQLCLAVSPLLEGNPCLCLDKNENGVVDLTDLLAFEKCITGPEVPWSQDLYPECVP